MPKIKVNRLMVNYEQQGAGEPIVLIPYLAADHACYAFQVAEYAKHFSCISVDLRGTGESESSEGQYSTEDLADDVASFMNALGVPKAHISGLSLGAGVGLWLAAKYPERVQSLSLHSGWHKTDLFVRTVIESFQISAKALNSVAETLIRAMFPWCFTPELYASKPEFIESLVAFVRSRPTQTVASFLQQSDAVLAHDASAHLSRITAPTQITFGAKDLVTSPRFAEPIQSAIRDSELIVFENASHAHIYEKTEEFNQKTLAFLQRHSGAAAQRARTA